MNTKCFKYGPLSPSKDGAIRIQMRLGREYYNHLVEAENKRRQQVWGLDTVPPPPHDNCKCDECKSHWKSLREKYRGTPPFDVKPLRAQATAGGLYWGTYLIIEEAFAAAWKKTDCFYLVRFKSWRDGGIMGAQIQRGTNSALQVDIACAPDPRSGRRAGQRHLLRVRVGSNEDRSPKWSDPIALEMHRPLQGRITWVKICLYYRGEREIWSVNFTCADIPDRTDNAATGYVAIDVGWRKMENGSFRLAFATGDDGYEDQLTLNDRWVERTERADRIRAYRDRRLNELKEADPRCKGFHKPQRIKKFAAGHYVDESYREWIQYERHLEEYELGCRRKSVDARRDVMRVWLRDLRRKYATAIIKDSLHKEMKATKVTKATGMPQAARRQGHLCAPGEIIEEIGKVFGRNTGVAVIAAPGTTATCLQCGNVNEVGAELTIQCERCGSEMDRDRVSTRNMLSLYFNGKSRKPTARKSIARFAKRHKNLEQPKECQLNGL